MGDGAAGKPSMKDVLSSTYIIVMMLIILPLVVGLWIFFNYTIKSQPISEGWWITPVDEGATTTRTIRLQEETFETLVIKVTYPYQIGVIIEDIVYGEASGNSFTGEIGETLRFEWRGNGEIRIQPVNSTLRVLNIENLKNRVEMFNFPLNEHLLEVEATVLNITYPSRDNLPEDVSQDFTKLLEGQDFIKWLNSEGFNYTISGIRPSMIYYPFYPEPYLQDFYYAEFEAELLVEGIEARCRFPEFMFSGFSRISTNSDLVEKLRMTPDVNESVVCIYIYRRNEAEYVLGIVLNSGDPYSGRSYDSKEVLLENESYVWLPHSGIRYHLNLNYFKTFTFSATSEVGIKAMRILESNKLTKKLLESGGDSLYFLKIQIGEEKELPLETAILCRNSTLTLRINMDDEKIEEISFYSFTDVFG
ncbi:MAG: hypothetical protein QW304_02175 [Thermoproteota archaeon]